MKKSIITLPAIKLVGIKTRTNNKDEIEPQAGKILPCIQRYFHGLIAETIPNRKKPGTTIVFTLSMKAILLEIILISSAKQFMISKHFLQI